MSRPAPLSTAADRRPHFEVRGDVSRTIGKASGARGGATEPLARTPGSGLTLRERRVKKILLKELEKISNKDFGGGLSYNEKQKLVKTLDVDYIDAELAKMDAMEDRIRAGFKWVGIPFAVFAVGLATYYLATGQPLESVFPILYPLLFGFTFVQTLRANRRRRWIYEALRELSDADDMDIQLPESVALADLLIDRLVAEEDAASGVPLRRTRA